MRIVYSFLKIIFPLLIFTACRPIAGKAQAPSKKDQETAQLKIAQHWVDSVYQSLNEEERIGQLFMIAAYSGGDNFNQDQVEKLLTAHQIGGLIFMQGTPEAQARLTNRYQKLAQIPLLIGMDAEWGLGMRLTGVQNFPQQMTLGATGDTALMYAIGQAIATQCKRLGVHVNFAPVVDVNNNPANPVINFRSFGENKVLVAQMGIAYMRGLQDNGIMACAKHFPGHGDVATDSHLDLPVIKKSLTDLKATEFYPFQKLSDAGVQSMMIAHLSVPALDQTAHLPTTLSKRVVTDLLRNEIGFQGLIFTDALNMKGVTKYFPDGETDVRAFLAGNDVLLFSQNVPLAIKKIKEAVAVGKTDMQHLEQSVKRILMAKYRAGLSTPVTIEESGVTAALNKDIAALWNQTARSAITIAQNSNNLAGGLKAGSNIAYVTLGNSSNPEIIDRLKANGMKVSMVNAGMIMSIADRYDAVIVGVHRINKYPGKSGSYGISAAQIAQLKQLSELKQVIIVYFGNAYTLKYSCKAPTVLVAYEDNTYTQNAVADILTGNIKANGQLPVTVCQ